MTEILRVEGLKKTFSLSKKQQRIERTSSSTKVAVDDLSFTANQGEIFGLLGPNGAGKTTTLRMLATLIKPDHGDAWLDGCSIVSQPEAVRSKIGFLTSELKLEDFFTPNYLYDFFSELHGVPPAIAAARKQAMFARFGIDKFAEVKVANLSTGMKQKLSIVISLVHDPAIIISQPRQDHHPVHPHFQPGGTPVRPRGHHHRRPSGSVRHTRRGVQQGKHRRPFF